MSVNPEYIINNVEFGTSRLQDRIEAINSEAFSNSIQIYDKNVMTGRGRGKYAYKKELRAKGEEFFRNELGKYFKNNKIWYVV